MGTGTTRRLAWRTTRRLGADSCSSHAAFSQAAFSQAAFSQAAFSQAFSQFVRALPRSLHGEGEICR